MHKSRHLADDSIQDSQPPLLLAESQNANVKDIPKIHAWDEDTLLEIGQQSLGLYLGAFQHWEASEDEYLPEYIITKELPNTIWHDYGTFVFAPPGGGKTALRIYTIMNCWQRLGSAHPFPIQLLPSPQLYTNAEDQESILVQFLFRSALQCLAVGIVSGPDRFLRLEQESQSTLVHWLSKYLHGRFLRIIDMLRAGVPSWDIARMIDPSYVTGMPAVEYELQVQLAAIFESLCPEDDSNFTEHADIVSKQNFIYLVDLLLNQLGFGSIYMLIDGVDNELYGVEHPTEIKIWINQILSLLQEVPSERIYLKAYLPDELRPLLEDVRINTHKDTMRMITLEWTSSLLVEILRKRILFAADGLFDSFDSVAGPSCENIEETLLEDICLLPRETLVVARQLIIEYARRTGTNGGAIEMCDVNAARELYFQRFPT